MIILTKISKTNISKAPIQTVSVLSFGYPGHLRDRVEPWTTRPSSIWPVTHTMRPPLPPFHRYLGLVPILTICPQEGRFQDKTCAGTICCRTIWKQGPMQTSESCPSWSFVPRMGGVNRSERYVAEHSKNMRVMKTSLDILWTSVHPSTATKMVVLLLTDVIARMSQADWDRISTKTLFTCYKYYKTWLKKEGWIDLVRVGSEP